MLQREGNRLSFAGDLFIGEITGIRALIHQTIKAGYQDLVLDFSQCSACFPATALATCCQVMKLREHGIDFELVLPRQSQLAKLFTNANWAHFLDPERHAQSRFRGFTQLPATLFTDHEEQHQAVNRILNAILGAIPDLDRKGLAALEWSVNEITDNVLVHSQSPVGGLVQLSMFERSSKRIEYIVVDAGLGIPKTLRQGHPEITSDSDALERAIREGVTRDKTLGQGNGLYGSFQISSHSKALFQLQSGFAKLVFTSRHGLRVSTERVPFDGTLVAAQINLSDPLLLQEALKFDGRLHIPVDFVETHYERHDRPEVLFKLRDESSSFGSRVAGIPVRTKLINLIGMCPGQRVIVDFEDISLVSSSFADEVFGKLFLELGPMSFAQKFEFRNVCTTVQQLTDRAIAQRLAGT